MRVSILVPTLGRARALRSVIDSVRTTTPIGQYEMIFVVDPDDADTHQALHQQTGIDVRILASGGTYPQKTNAAYRASECDLVLPTADDVRFHPGWYAEAMKMFRLDKRVKVLGTNDLSPATLEQDHSTMPLIRRSYIEDPGCVVDEPGIIFHEGYHHNFVETEIWKLARCRGVAKFAKRSIIEHLHPDWGKRDEDSTDERGHRTNWDEDLDLFRERMAPWM
jgi:glycosyltransferase involved in cell wall biosynthesis